MSIGESWMINVMKTMGESWMINVMKTMDVTLKLFVPVSPQKKKKKLYVPGIVTYYYPLDKVLLQTWL